ncbi:LOW QUALITY PROTEIN: protocadherin-20 [Cottoperca gobio]|uniref:LOW QUALITY PROTEIN: protocadherin-20 n=1 Tax=Cottoperca gobio TaxID=56716 RepID=A0A6J2QGA0_COTGO|nr:LOW QUALITY PROTEIN: protocadherin-20-like [Cottoperca gobio]
MQYAFGCAGLSCCLCPHSPLAAEELVACVRAMGYWTPHNMNWAGLLQNLLIVIHLQQSICGSVRFSVPEEQGPGVLAGSLSEHFSPPYQLLTQKYLWMDNNTGNFYTTDQKMDREALCREETKDEECIILHNAVVGPSGDLIQFPVIIEDINDNAPHFESSEIHLKISEDVTVGISFLLDDNAQDRDARYNGKLQYQLKDFDGVFSLNVEENSSVIMLVVQTALDRETRDLYQMVLVATDCGSGPLSATATLIVTVTDVNDNCPSFSSDSVRSVTIPGDSPKNMLVVQVRATDPDSGLNAAIIYSLSPKVSERAKKLFSLDSLTGSITLTQDLQSDNSEELLLKVLARGHHCPPADTQVTVSVLPKVNQELAIKIGFIAEHQNQTMVLPENQPPTVLAVLELEGDSGFKGSSLAIENEVPFTLSPQNGKYLLSTSKPLDYELKSEHHISVVVHGRSAEGSVISPSGRVIRVLVADVNDNAPHFLQSHYQLEVEENNQPGMSLLQLSASDADSGYNGRVTYRLDKHTSTIFHIDPVTGQLSVSAVLDREQQGVHELSVFAQDSGSPPLESVATVSICVLDQNDNAPVFVTPHFIFFIPENIPPFAQVGRVGVTDLDKVKNGYLELHVVSSSGPFVLDNTLETLRTTTNMDREKDDRYELYLLASDHGHPVALTSTARVTIFVEDINDNQPKVIFPSSNSSCQTVSPATITGTIVTKILAVDEDSGLNSEITYTVVAPDPGQNSSPFRVDSRSGNITVAQQLLRKDLGMHHLFIVVRDGGKPALYTTVWVNLLVNESMGPCYLERAPTWSRTSDPSKAPICEAEDTRSAQLTLLVGLGMMLVSTCWLVATAVLYLKQKRASLQQNKRGHIEENEIPLRLKDKYY